MEHVLKNYLIRAVENHAEKVLLDNIRNMAWGSFVHTGGSGIPQFESFFEGVRMVVKHYGDTMNSIEKRGYK